MGNIQCLQFLVRVDSIYLYKTLFHVGAACFGSIAVHQFLFIIVQEMISENGVVVCSWYWWRSMAITMA